MYLAHVSIPLLDRIDIHIEVTMMYTRHNLDEYELDNPEDDVEVEEPVLKRFYQENGQDYILAGVPLTWVNSKPEGTITIDPSVFTATLDQDETEDAFVYYCTKEGDGLNSNYGTSTILYIRSWTHSPGKKYFESYIKFDFSSLPANARLDSAKLDLYNSPAAAVGAIRMVDLATTSTPAPKLSIAMDVIYKEYKKAQYQLNKLLKEYGSD